VITSCLSGSGPEAPAIEILSATFRHLAQSQRRGSSFRGGVRVSKEFLRGETAKSRKRAVSCATKGLGGAVMIAAVDARNRTDRE
jgi:hypothetical protein